MGNAVAARENGKKGGRPPGAIPRISRVKANELYRDNRSPLDVMIDNMNFWWDKSKNVGVRLDEALDELDQFKQAFSSSIDEMSDEQKKVAVSEFGKRMEKVGKMASQLAAYRDKAQECAVDAAPFCHPKFASISWQQPGDKDEILDISPELNGRIAVTTVLDVTLGTDSGRRKQTNGKVEAD